jgi:hypothetical protein
MNPLDDLISKLDDSVYVADLFLLLHLDELDQPTATNTENVRLEVPECIDILMMKDSKDSDAVLKAMIMWARPDLRCSNEPPIDMIIDDIRANYAALRQYKFLQPIEDESDKEVISALARVLSGPRKRVGPIARMKNTIRKAVTTILSHSKRTGTAILMRGRQLAEFLRDRLVSLEMPSKADQVVKKKAAFTARLFAFKGGQATKFFVGLALGIGGLFPGAPAIINVAGLALALVDP